MDGHCVKKQKVTSSIPDQGSFLCCGFHLWLGSVQEVNQSMFLSHMDVSLPLFLPPSLPLSLKININKQNKIKDFILPPCICTHNHYLGYPISFSMNMLLPLLCSQPHWSSCQKVIPTSTGGHNGPLWTLTSNSSLLCCDMSKSAYLCSHHVS